MSATYARPSFPRRFGTAGAALMLSFGMLTLVGPAALAAVTPCSGGTVDVAVDVAIPEGDSARIEYVAPGAVNVTIEGSACVYYTSVSSIDVYKASGNDSETLTIAASNTDLLPEVSIDLNNGNDDTLILEGTSGSDNLDPSVFDYDNGNNVEFLIFDAGSGNDVMVDDREFNDDDVTFGGAGGTDTADRSDRTKKIEWTLPLDVENVIGGSGNDVLKGNLAVNRIEGGGGNDDLYGYAGNDVLFGNDGNDDLYGGDANDTLVGGDDDDKFDGGSGTDLVSFDESSYPDAASGDIRFSLRWTSKSKTGGAGDDYAVEDTVENLRGSSYDDELIGDENVNYIDSGLGDDMIEGDAGADVLDGGLGFDTISYRRSSAAVRVNLAQPYPIGGHATGDLTGGFEGAIGSLFSDTLTGTAGPNALHGEDGNDLLIGLAGEDVLDGGLGIHDTITYAASSAGVTVSLLAGTGKGGDAEGDEITKVEDLIGSEENDILVGGRVANVISGLGGNDMIMGGLWGDTIDGGSGVDTASYSEADEGVTVSLRAGTAKNEAGTGTDRLKSIENVIGSAFDDTLLGSDGANNMNGGGGDDLVSGLGGADKLFGSNGDDRIDGGDGNDFLEPGAGADSANGGAGTDTYRSGVGADVVTNCEK